MFDFCPKKMYNYIGKKVKTIKLDYSLKTVEERRQYVENLLANLEEPPNSAYLEILANYLVIPIEREERKERKVLTDNRLATINKRETSLEGLVSQLENGEDGIYNLINESKTTILQPKVSITKKDLEEVPFLAQMRDSITRWETMLRTAEGKEAYIIKKALIEMRKDQYVIKTAYRKPIVATKLVRSRPILKLEEDYTIDAETGDIIPEKFSLCDEKVCQAILCNYSKLKENSWGDFEGDLYFLMEDFDKIASIALADNPLLETIVINKIDGKSNLDIQKILEEEYNKKHSLEYISSLWRNKIPQMIATEAQAQLLNWHYLQVEKGKYKKCSRCGQIKLAHSKYFSKNKTSKDGWYSICKCCRSRKAKKDD